jgi:FdhD protein
MSKPTIVREPARAAGIEVDIERAAHGTSTPARDLVAVEEPLEIRLNGWRWLVTMRTPGDDGDLIVGLLASEGVIARAADVESIVFTRHPEEPDLANVADVQLPQPLDDLQRRLARHQVMAGTSCGLCGKSAVEALLTHQPPLPDGPTLEAALFARVPELLAGAQPVFRATGGLHAAALLDGTGTLLVAREDVGRHNAVDKVLGWRLRAGDASARLLVVSGRASFEIVQKAHAAGVPAIAAVSAPSSLAVTLARDANLTLAGFVRDGGYNVYAGAARLRPAPDASEASRIPGPDDEPLAFIPTVVRRALDGVACKISLADWRALTLAERERLVALATGPLQGFADRLTTDILARTGQPPRQLSVPKDGP